MTLGSLFAGIGGFDLGFERAGFKTVWQVEKNAYCRRVLRRHFPHADRRVTDVRFGGARNLARVDVICGGFPCQDISNAGLRAGIDGARSGLWFTCTESLANYDPDTSSWRMSQRCLDGEWEEFSETFPKSGMTRNGTLYLQPMLVLPTFASAYGRLPTPTATDWKRTPMKRSYAVRSELGHMDTLAQWAVRMSGLRHARLVPDLWEWVMGFPAKWTDLEHSGTP